MKAATALTLIFILAAAISIADEAAHSKPFADAINSHQEPIPIDGAPAELKRLVDDGHVKLVYDAEPKFIQAGRGWADFHIQLRHTFKYSLTKTPKASGWLVKVVVRELEPHIELSHLVRLPASLRSPGIWRNRILWHEFDHVAVSLDPRPMMLLQRLLKQMPAIERNIDSKDPPTEEVVGQWINEEVNRRLHAVRELMRQNNLTLDKLSAHGAQAIAHRAVFFSELYSKERLAEQKFPFLTEVLELLDADDYSQAKLPFLDVDPASR